MARKRRARSPLPSPSPSPPPPTPPREESSSEEEEEEAEDNPATQKPPQNPNTPSTDAADADSSDGGQEESSDSETDANAFQLREVARSPGKPSAAASDADEEDGTSSDSPEPVQKKAARKPKAEAGKKRQAAESSPSGDKAKKAKADVEKAVPLSGKAPSELSASSKGKKQKEKALPDRSPFKPAARRWTTEDEIKVLEALVSHIKTNGTQPSAVELIAAVGDRLERKNCSKTEMYEKVRNLKQRHEKAVSSGTLPGNEDDLRKFNLSDAVWGESAKEVAAAPISQNDGASSKSKKGQTNKEKADDHSKGGTAKEAATADTPVKSKKWGNHKEDLEGEAKTDTTKETTNTATQDGGTLVGSKSGKSDKEKMAGDAEILGPKEATAVTQNGGAHEEKMDTDPNGKNIRKGFDELEYLYPNLTSYVESIQAQHACGETLKRAFEFISYEKACALETKIKKQRVAEMKMEIRRADTKKEVTNLIIGLLD